MVQIEFANNVVEKLKTDDSIIGLAVGGSWITNELDEYSDLDFILVTKENVSGNISKMLDYAKNFGNLLSGFTGEHVGEPRVLICLFQNQLLHVDIKFLTLDEFKQRIETPTILLDNGNQLKNILEHSEAKFPYPDFQWIEDRFWIWVHYALLKIGRGEYVEAFDFLGFLRMTVLGPLLHIKNGNLPRGVRKIETQILKSDFEELLLTLPKYEKQSLLESLLASVSLYRKLRKTLYSDTILLNAATENTVMSYFNKIT